MASKEIKMGLEVRYGWWGLDKARRASTLWHFQITTNYGAQHPCNWKVYTVQGIFYMHSFIHSIYALCCGLYNKNYAPYTKHNKFIFKVFLHTICIHLILKAQTVQSLFMCCVLPKCILFILESVCSKYTLLSSVYGSAKQKRKRKGKIDEF